MKARLFCLLLLASCAVATAQQALHIERGFSPEKVYQFGDLDHVNLVNGNVVVDIPIGSPYKVGGKLSYKLQLVYNSKVWDYQQSPYNNGSSTDYYLEALPDRLSNAGMGWSLSLGRLLEPDDAENDFASWLYVGSDGSTHVFYPTLHIGDNEYDPANTVSYSRDSSYLRMRATGLSTREIDFPDGTTHLFERWNGRWRLKQIRDRFNNALNIAYSADEKTWTLTDTSNPSAPRTHRIVFSQVSWPYYANVLERVELASSVGTPATYSFGYGLVTYQKPCNHTLPIRTTVYVPVLSTLWLPDGSTFGFDYHSAVSSTTCEGPGAIRQLTLPTLGKIEYDYSAWYLPNEGCDVFTQYQTFHGVRQRRFLDANGAEIGRWLYEPSYSAEPSGPFYFCSTFGGGSSEVWRPTSEELRTTVTTPLNDKVVHYFSIHNRVLDPLSPSANGFTGYDQGLPFTRFQTDATGTRFLSTQAFDCDAAGANCTLKRSTYVRYERDQLPPNGSCTPAIESFHYDCINTNRRLVSSRTVYHDDGSRFADDDFSNFDGLGNYRTQATNGSFQAGNVRQTTRNYNPGNGEYKIDPATNAPAAGHSFVMRPTDAAWILGNYSWEQVTEGGRSLTTGLCYDANTGFVARKRVYKNGSTEAAQDVVTVYTPDGGGNLVREQYYGGDVQALTANGTTCTMALPNDQYRIDHTYQYGVLATSQYKDLFGGATGVLGFYNAERTIDASTGLVASSTDSAGVRTTLSYDIMGRLIQETPDAGNGGITSYIYTKATGPSALAKVDVQRKNNAGSATLAQSRVVFDSHGRVWKEEQLMPSGSWSTRETKYNAQGWHDTVSELGATNKVTRYSDYDPFGRARTITLPDSKTVTLTHSGVRLQTRNIKVGTGRDVSGNVVETTATTTEQYDRQGRLWKLTEPSGASGANVTTEYGYDPGNRLSSVRTVAAEGTQNRTFAYDGRGFLYSETHPEKGSAGNGTVTYSKHNSRGHAERKIDGPWDYTFAYDRAERLVRVTETGSGSTVKELTYGTGKTATDRSAGKLKTTRRLNYHVYLGTNVNVTETYTYGGKDGRVSRRDTSVDAPSAVSFTQSWTWNDLGQPATITYPTCTHAGCSGVAAARTLSPGYTNGRLTSVPGFATSISYHPNGLVSQVAHTNNLKWNQANDPNGIRRPYWIYLGDVMTGGLGPYAYDGAGNVAKVGGENYVYDKVSRVVQGTMGSGDRQDYTFDSFGNLKSITTSLSGGTAQLRSFAVDSTTNHLSASGYDGAGNLTGWGTYSYGYSIFNELRSVAGGGNQRFFAYTSDNERLWSHDVPAGKGIWRVRDLDGKVLREYINNNGVWSWGKDHVYRDGVLMATVSPTEGTRHIYVDHLGSPRHIADSAGGGVEGHHYFPFGEELAFSQSGETMRFTGHERDFNNTSGTTDDLDYMHARHYNPMLGRFMSIDPVMQSERATFKPQLWNRYTYALANPVTYTDPTGEDVSLLIAFEGVFQHEQKRAILDLVKKYFEGLQVGKVYVADAAEFKESNTRFFFFKAAGTASITVSSQTGAVAKPGFVPAGGLLAAKDLTPAERLQAIANVVSHEVLAHQFRSTAFESIDALAFDRHSIFATDPAIVERVGTIADHSSLVDPATRRSAVTGPLPIHDEDLRKARETLAPLRLDPPRRRE